MQLEAKDIQAVIRMNQENIHENNAKIRNAHKRIEGLEKLNDSFEARNKELRRKLQEMEGC